MATDNVVLEHITQGWRLFFWLTDDFAIAKESEDERYRIEEIIPGGSRQTRIYFLYDKIQAKSLALKLCYDKRPQPEHAIISTIDRLAPGTVAKIHDIRSFNSGYNMILMDKGLPVKKVLENITMRQDGRVSIIVKELFCGMVKALGAVHNAGYYHKDVRLENFTVFCENGELIPRLIDFGLASARTERELIINNQEFIRPPEFVFLSRYTTSEDIAYEANHDIFALCLSLLMLLELAPSVSLTDELETELKRMYEQERYHSTVWPARDLLRLAPWYQCIRLVHYLGLPPKSLTYFHDSPMGRFLASKYRFSNLGYLHGQEIAEKLKHEPKLLDMLRQCLNWSKTKRVQNCEQLFELHLSHL